MSARIIIRGKPSENTEHLLTKKQGIQHLLLLIDKVHFTIQAHKTQLHTTQLSV